jgi:uridine phosphorylase
MHTNDSFYGQKEPETMPVATRLAERWTAWTAAGALCSEMESAALFVVAAVRGVSAGSICLVAGGADGRRLGADESPAGIAAAIGAALDAVTQTPVQ